MRPMQPTFDLSRSSQVEALFSHTLTESNIRHLSHRTWPCDSDLFTEERLKSAHATEKANSTTYVMYEVCGGVALAVLQYGHVSVIGAHSSAKQAAEVVDAVEEIVGRNEYNDPVKVPITFWAYGKHGPELHNRELDARNWDDIRSNYPSETREKLEPLMAEGFQAGVGGQLILWNGEPGTGKTNAIRALAQEWRDWARFHYITDPDKFFGDHADYMLRVMLEQADEERKEAEQWRILILEDAGEMLRADAKREVGQALSRFLNAADGLIGQGLRVVTLVTTNEEVGTWHEAVTRHGRAAAQIEFDRFDPEEAREWLDAHDIAEGSTSDSTLADLYARLENRLHREQKPPVGFAAVEG